MIFDWKTRNVTFINTFFYLRNKGIKNNAFFLALLDPSLQGVDPYDPNLTLDQKCRIFAECRNNFWYFLREVVRVQTPGGTSPYGLNPGLLPYHFLSELNISVYLELPRQTGKTTSVIIKDAYWYNFKSTKSKFLYFHKDHAGSKNNLKELRKIIDSLPEYLKFTSVYKDGKKLKPKGSVESIQHIINGNEIKAKPGPTSKERADSLGRGDTAPHIYLDEHAFIKHVDTLMNTIVPAYMTASNISREKGNPFNIVITTTPGDRTTQHGEFSYQLKESSTKWFEEMYDLSINDIYNIINSNPNSIYIYVKYMYNQMGYSEDWFNDRCKAMNNDWAAIKREYLLEWDTSNSNNPFDPEELEIIDGNKKEPIHKLLYSNGLYTVNIYEDFDFNYFQKYVPIMGVDVSGTQSRVDSSTFTIIDSKTTKVVATFNSNMIDNKSLCNIIIDLTKKYYNKMVINVETNGGYGDGVISILKSYIKRNLYCEKVERILEERNNGIVGPKKHGTQIRYGLATNKYIRNNLIDILRDRVERHKDKFNCPILISELHTLEQKQNGKVEHSNNNHDDQIFSYLMALYVWYEGKELSRYGIIKYQLETDEYTENDDYINDIELPKEETNPVIYNAIMNQFSKNDNSVSSSFDTGNNIQTIGEFYHDTMTYNTDLINKIKYGNDYENNKIEDNKYSMFFNNNFSHNKSNNTPKKNFWEL